MAAPAVPEDRNPLYPRLPAGVAGDLYQILLALRPEPVRRVYVACGCGAGQDPDCRSEFHLRDPDDETLLDAVNWCERTIRADSPAALFDTVEYQARTTGTGIVVQVRNGRVSFAPFNHQHYANDAFNLLRYRGQLLWDKDDSRARVLIADEARLGGRPVSLASREIRSVDTWRFNGGMLRYDLATPGVVDDRLYELFFREVAGDPGIPGGGAAGHDDDDDRPPLLLPDLDVVVNKRDFPLLKRDFATHPFEDTFGTDAPYAYPPRTVPVLSGSCDPTRFADLLAPTHEDILRGLIQSGRRPLGPDGSDLYPEARYPPVEKRTEWASRPNRAVFRGSCTGMGTSPDTNPRLALCRASLAHPDLLDAKLVRSNPRPRCHRSAPFELRLPEERPEYFGGRLTLQEQSDRYRFVVTPPGHVAAYRLSYELSSDCVVILLDSPYKVWYSHLLRPHVHYLPAANADEVLDIVRRADSPLQRIACLDIIRNANAFAAEHLTWEAMVARTRRQLAQVAPRIPFAYPDRAAAEALAARLTSHATPAFVTEHPLSSQFAEPETSFPHRPPGLHRTYDLLRAQQRMFRAARPMPLRWHEQRTPLRPHVRVVVLEKAWPFVRKSGRRDLYLGRERSLEHEAAVGEAAINPLLLQVPNFAFTFGLADGDVWLEYVQGQRLLDWIPARRRDPDFEVRLLLLLTQIAAALDYARDQAALVHGDLNLRNVVVQSLPEAKTFDYPAGGETVVRLAVRDVAVLLDFDQSSACVYDAHTDGVVPLLPWQATRYRDPGFDLVHLLLSLLDETDRALRTRGVEPLGDRLQQALAGVCVRALAEPRYDPACPYQRRLFVRRFRTAAARERLAHDLNGASFLQTLLRSPWGPALRPHVDVVVPGILGSPADPPSLSTSMHSSLQWEIYWAAHFGPERREAVADAVLGSLERRPVLDSDAGWMVRLQVALERHQFRLLERFFEEAAPRLSAAFDNLAGFARGRRLIERPRRAEPTLEPRLPRPAVSAPLDLWHPVAEGTVTAPIAGDLALALSVLKRARFFCDGDLLRSTGLAPETLRAVFWSVDGHRYLALLAHHNYVAALPTYPPESSSSSSSASSATASFF